MTPAIRACAVVVVLSALHACASLPAPRPTPTPSGLPDRLSDRDFWALQASLSEPGGYFRIEDNFTSNETEVGHIFTMLRERNVSGDVYLGVGPEQNYTYIAAVRPRMAFIIDIRRQAAVQHLMFKALFEMAGDRAGFISLLFSRPRPPGLDTGMAIPALWSAYRMIRPDTAAASDTWTRIVERLTRLHRFSLDEQELAQLRHVYFAFQRYGPAITTRGPPSGRGGDFMSLTGFAEDTAGNVRSFLSSEDNFRYVKMLHERNLIVPVTGDFAGPKAIRAIGAYLTERRAVVRAFYLSNVEQYLFGDGVDAAFYANAATLPVDSGSVFIRPYTLRRWFRGLAGAPLTSGRSAALCPIGPFLRAAGKGLVTNNEEALACPQ